MDEVPSDLNELHEHLWAMCELDEHKFGYKDTVEDVRAWNMASMLNELNLCKPMPMGSSDTWLCSI